MKARKLSILIALVMLVGILGGCGQQGTQAPTTSATSSTTSVQTPAQKFTTDNITIHQWTFLDPTATSGRGKILNDLVNQFQKEHPNVKIETNVQQWTQLLAKQTAAFYAGEAPDIMWNAAEYITGILKLGAYEPFENLFLDEWTAEDTADVSDPIWGAGATDGKHYFFDICRSPFGIAYRADLFKKYGLGTEYNDVTDLFQALTAFNGKVENGVQVYGFGTGYKTSNPANNWLCVGLATAGELLNKDGTANFATETGVRMLELQKAMIDDYKITPTTCFAADFEDIYNDFDAGKYAAIITSPTRIATLRKNATFDPQAIQVMPYPKINGKDALDVSGGWCVGVSSKSKYKYEAGKFVELLGSKETDWAMCSEGGQVAVRKSTYTEHPDFFQQPENQYLYVFKDIMEKNIYPIPPFPFVGIKESTLMAMANYYLDKTPAMDALKKEEDGFNKTNGVTK